MWDLGQKEPGPCIHTVSPFLAAGSESDWIMIIICYHILYIIYLYEDICMKIEPYSINE